MHQLECLSTISGWSYTGIQNTTQNGRQCQRWDEQYPHSHNVTAAMLPDASLAEVANYCRSPNADTSGPWCYTTDERVRFEYCDISKCSEGELVELVHIYRPLSPCDISKCSEGEK